MFYFRLPSVVFLAFAVKVSQKGVRRILQYMERNSVALSPKHYCNGNASMRAVCLAHLHITVNNIHMLRAACSTFYGEFMSPATRKALGSPRQVSDIFVRL